MTKDALGPTQVAYDRIQRAGTRSPMVIGNFIMTYELHKDGVRLRARSPGQELTKIVTWTQLALCKVDPLMETHEAMMTELANNAQEVARAGT